jgi:hypothetical protein
MPSEKFVNLFLNKHKNDPEFCRSMLYGLYFHCFKGRSCNCVLYKTLNFQDDSKTNIQKIKNLSKEEVISLYDQHIECMLKNQ